MDLSRIFEMNTTFSLIPWVFFFPLLGILINLIFGKRLGEKFSGRVGSLASGLSFLVSLLLANSLRVEPGVYHLELAKWLSIGNMDIAWGLRLDTLSATMMLVVSGVGTLIHIYSIGYMSRDVHHNGDPKRFTRFFIYMNLFIAMMMLLVSADNYLVMFVGWEGVGLCSYLLIGFWYEKGKDGIGNAIAGKKAFITNRIGDLGVLIALFIIFGAFGTFDFDKVFAQAPAMAAIMPSALLAITLFLLLGVTGKSAQLPLYVWLPDAMAGPTPVSALIHAATMVTAGVYLIARSSALFSLVPLTQDIVVWVGALTALFAATIALGQYDIKRVLAYSTISQLGYMVAAVGMGAYAAGMFHLVTHAFFKALLFLSAGSVIQGLERGEEALHAGHHAESSLDPQDMRNMGGLRNRMPVTFWVFLIGALALSGIAPLEGFFSKDEILAEAFHLQSGAFILLIIAAFLTALYMGRQVFMVFFAGPRSKPAGLATESKAIITVPLAILAFLSLTGGVLNLPLGGYETPGAHLLTGWLSKSIAGIAAGEFNMGVALLSTALELTAILLAWLLYARRWVTTASAVDPMRKLLGPVFTALEHKWWVDEFYQTILLKPFHIVSDCLAHPFDQGIIDGTVNGIATGTKGLAGWLRKAQSGYVRNYALAIVAGLTIILAYLLTH
jgi:NADH-quinone oxidoreductase subunit L